MPEIIEMKLTKPARSKGGDRYDGMTSDEESINIYVPQSISRPEHRRGDPIVNLKLTISEGSSALNLG